MTKTDMVAEYHKTSGAPRKSDDYNFNALFNLFDLRERLIAEEAEEVFKADSSEEILKELCDLVYVAIGYAECMDWDFDGAFEAVHKNNMRRMFQDDGSILRREDGKIMKNPRYKDVNLQEFIYGNHRAEAE